ncbi:nucleoside-diphosphate sugar epimerase [Pseudomonas alcaligenes]|uniref:Nucleoside-diphosphate sugar epimerase n=1 Tax=Aquipseudomonas alcaligenes TaxID=43263 RepID=A0ABR7S156_AQUAC|nr:nucleoside-diphosphate sugar epimerase [Pseudomonas alcaligenes]
MVTGANGHLGNTLVRALLARGERVRAGVRDPLERSAFAGLDCELVYAELQDKQALVQALQGVEVLYQVAAVFRHWARDPQAEIVVPNVEGTRNVLEAAAAAGVKRVVYVSSVAAVGHNGQALNEQHWNSEEDNAYYRSKILSERMAQEVAQRLGLDLVVVLPAAMVGPHAQRLTDTMDFLDSVLKRQVPLDPGFHFNFVDVRDVAEGMILAAEKGRPGERYILASEQSSPLQALITAANSVASGYRLPPPAPRWLLLALAWLQERAAQLTGKPAKLLVSQVRLFHGVRQEYSIAKARAELGYRPRPVEQALREAFAFLQQRAG